MSVQIQLRRATAAQWATANPILGIGEPGFEIDTAKIKIGDGASAWNSLAYFISGSSANVKTETRTISSLEATNKQLILAQTPNPSNELIVLVAGGSVQTYNVDFVVSTNVLDWLGWGMETIINSGDILILNYKF